VGVLANATGRRFWDCYGRRSPAGDPSFASEACLPFRDGKVIRPPAQGGVADWLAAPDCRGGGSSDPRCGADSGASTASLLLAEPDFCRGDDLLTCTVHNQDPAIDLAGARCHPRPDASGSRTIACDRRSASGGEGASEPRSVDSIRLGALIAALCRPANCPEGF
jgi:hypothetical protein